MKQHIHKYIRHKLGKNKYEVFRCAIPGCVHFITASLIVGRESVCWRCGRVFVVTADLVRKKPHCAACTRRKDKLGELTDKFVKLLSGEQEI